MTESTLVEPPATRDEGGDTGRRSTPGLTALFGCTALLGAALLFLVQPMVAKLVLPSYGGSATVWSTSSLFFQVLLLGGYVYAHLTTTRLSRRVQPRIHLVVLALPLLTLPVVLPGHAVPDDGTSPVLWLIRTLALMIGLPFVVVSTTGPLLQRWYSWTGSRRSDDPYFLFAASNLGSFGGLLAYPLLLEPRLTLDQQRLLWSVGFCVFAVLMAGCGVVAGRRREPGTALAARTPSVKAAPVGGRRLLAWTALAFLPSALMLSVTAHLSTDVAPIPLLWVVPLAIYLATFVLAFARSTRRPPVVATRVAVACCIPAAVISTLGEFVPVLPSILLNTAMLALVAYAAHARLAADRPAPEHLTLFYLVISVGGALGGLLNGVVAPVLFDRIWEYPLILVACPALLVGVVSAPDSALARRFNRHFLLVCGVLLLGVAAAAALVVVLLASHEGAWVAGAALAGVALASYPLTRRPTALALSLVLALGVAAALDSQATVERSRTFYGSYSVEERGDSRVLVHGTTAHGSQFMAADERDVPTTYYARSGPIGDVFGSRLFKRVGVIGLGAGTLAAYGTPGQEMTFFEIDPEIIRIASDPQLFSYLADSRARVRTVAGDGRLLMEKQAAGSFDLVVIDAFNSDAIPVHLLTREALRVYADTLADDGVLAIHISNRVFDLEPVLAGASRDLRWNALVGLGGEGRGARESRWVLLTRDAEELARLRGLDGWRRVDTGDVVAWTDDYSSVLDVLAY
jgi:hypothetical protein